MTKLIWMSDPHFAEEGDVLGHDPRVRLDAAIAHINRNHADAAMCIISGDIVNRGTRAGYKGVKGKLSDLDITYLPMIGNHDSRDLFREILPLPDTCMADFIQYQVATPDGILLCLDTHKAGSDAGEFCPARAEWLRETLMNAGNTPIFLFMHHPPMALGLPMQDTENLEDGDGFLDLISDFACVKYLCIGHVHRPISGTVRGIPFSTMRSVLYQAPPPRPEWTWETFKPSNEAPNIGIIQLEDSAVRIQFDQFCEYQLGVTPD
ncbi:phosphodiesterase [Leisingera methylohalidivorans]|uniref:Metallophosphoesterase n=1 Tax=Leisingera methylohalidivorans DSM 14336 TaxID=999552 RepID=V9VS61_9RHOB|nr:phosphodiesterase [Leisingera methylohalidivorans]AHC99696.1 metallophosphoesterase [Leisingera methylohalidivorans DSM 14336]